MVRHLPAPQSIRCADRRLVTRFAYNFCAVGSHIESSRSNAGVSSESFREQAARHGDQDG